MDDRIRQVMGLILNVPAESIGEDSSTGTIASWDSLHHMNLILALEQEFEAHFDEDQIPELTSFAAIREALTK